MLNHVPHCSVGSEDGNATCFAVFDGGERRGFLAFLLCFGGEKCFLDKPRIGLVEEKDEIEKEVQEGGNDHGLVFQIS